MQACQANCSLSKKARVCGMLVSSLIGLVCMFDGWAKALPASVHLCTLECLHVATQVRDDVWQLNLKRLKWRCLLPESLGARTLPWPC